MSGCQTARGLYNGSYSPIRYEEYDLVWADEFSRSGKPDTADWGYEQGFVRNKALQWFQHGSIFCKNGLLVIRMRKAEKHVCFYRKDSQHWRESRQSIHQTSCGITTRGKRMWQYGRLEIRARVSTGSGMWPGWGTLGIDKPWPANGENRMELNNGKLFSNMGCLGPDGKVKWSESTFKTDSLGDKWNRHFHVWRMDWTEECMTIYIDDRLLRKVNLDSLVNEDGSGFNPFRQPHYLLLGFVVGERPGTDFCETVFPQKIEVDYIRVYERKKR